MGYDYWFWVGLTGVGWGVLAVAALEIRDAHKRVARLKDEYEKLSSNFSGVCRERNTAKEAAEMLQAECTKLREKCDRINRAWDESIASEAQAAKDLAAANIALAGAQQAYPALFAEKVAKHFKPKKAKARK